MILSNIRETLIGAVEKRMLSDRTIGCLLSGGVDSSLVVGILKKIFFKEKELHTFTIGMPGATDIKYA
jgi:asparagine synthase (glutamine-hydrolysing)